MLCIKNLLSPPEPSYICNFLEEGTLMSVDYGNIFFGILRDTMRRLENGFGQLSNN